MSKNLFTYSIIMLLIIPIFGINFVVNFIGNIFIIIILVPILLLIVALLIFSSFKKNTQICTNCGLTIIGDYENCIYCGNSLTSNSIKNNESNKTSEAIIEIDAEEVN